MLISFFSCDQPPRERQPCSWQRSGAPGLQLALPRATEQRRRWARGKKAHLGDVVLLHLEGLLGGDPEHLGMIAGSTKETRARAAAILLKKPLPKDAASIGKVLDYLNSQSNKTDRDAVQDLLRKLAGRSDLRGRALDGLSRAPTPRDRELFLDALSGDDLLLVSTALKGLDRLENPAEPSAEAFELVRWIHLADSDPGHLGLRDKLAQRLEKNHGLRLRLPDRREKEPGSGPRLLAGVDRKDPPGAKKRAR